MAWQPRRNKYNNRSQVRNGHRYDSMMEAEYADVLELYKRAGKIDSWRPHPPAVPLWAGTKWKVDFLVTQPDNMDKHLIEILKKSDLYQEPQFYVEVKGFADPIYKAKLKYWKAEMDKPLFVVTRYAPMKFRIIDSVNVDGVMRAILEGN